ncbi:MAG: radical SAM protein, partial [Deltaproteobacteria bacterium]|nr:radical SAM protein [Deltaproteobacteria bacterium]
IRDRHISDNVLRMMRRGHNSEFIKRLIKNIRKIIPDVVLRSAFITGFPGETVRDYKELVRFLKEYRIDNAGFFQYSDEEGTASYNYQNKIDARTIRKRYQQLYEMQEEISYNLNQRHIGNIYNVLIDGEDKNYYIGRYYGQAPEIDGNVFIRKTKMRCTGFVRVKIENADSYDLYGSIAD